MSRNKQQLPLFLSRKQFSSHLSLKQIAHFHSRAEPPSLSILKKITSLEQINQGKYPLRP